MSHVIPAVEEPKEKPKAVATKRGKAELVLCFYLFFILCVSCLNDKSKTVFYRTCSSQDKTSSQRSEAFYWCVYTAMWSY